MSGEYVDRLLRAKTIEELDAAYDQSMAELPAVAGSTAREIATNQRARRASVEIETAYMTRNTELGGKVNLRVIQVIQ